jgi:hypothetical protein
LAVAVLFGLAMMALQVFIFWRIFTRVGYSGAYGLLMLVPLVNVGMLLFLAFGEWPVLRELAGLRQRVHEVDRSRREP